MNSIDIMICFEMTVLIDLTCDIDSVIKHENGCTF